MLPFRFIISRLACMVLTTNISAQFIVVSAHFTSDLGNRELKPLDTLQAGAQVLLGKDGYLAILHPSGQYWEADSAGSYQIPILSDGADLQLNLKPYLTQNFPNRRFTGAVSAGMPDYPLILLPAQNIYVLEDSLELVWWKMLSYQQEDTALNTEYEISIR